MLRTHLNPFKSELREQEIYNLNRLTLIENNTKHDYCINNVKLEEV